MTDTKALPCKPNGVKSIKAKQIGTYQTSIEPYEDCCVLFSPPHPVLRGDPAEAVNLYESLELEPLIEEALLECEIARAHGKQGRNSPRVPPISFLRK